MQVGPYTGRVPRIQPSPKSSCHSSPRSWHGLPRQTCAHRQNDPCQRGAVRGTRTPALRPRWSGSQSSTITAQRALGTRASMLAHEGFSFLSRPHTHTHTHTDSNDIPVVVLSARDISPAYRTEFACIDRAVGKGDVSLRVLAAEVVRLARTPELAPIERQGASQFRSARPCGSEAGGSAGNPAPRWPQLFDADHQSSDISGAGLGYSQLRDTGQSGGGNRER